jgi:glycosyltransferase involved in cell wall biosynthesis
MIAETQRRISASLDQLEEEFELIFVDDGSLDDTGELLRPIASQDARCRVKSLSRRPSACPNGWCDGHAGERVIAALASHT